MPSGYKTVDTLDKYQKKLEKDIIGGLREGPDSYYQDPLYRAGSSLLQEYLSGSPEAYQRFEAPFMRQFREQIIPQIAEQFGGIGALSSSAFNQQLAGASTDLSERLASLRGQLQLNMLPQALQYAGAPQEQKLNLLGMQTKSLVPKKPSALQSLLGGLGSGLGSFGSIFGLGKLFG